MRQCVADSTLGCSLAPILQPVCDKRIAFCRTYVDRMLVGTLFRASQFLSEELPIRLAHRVEELADLPDGLNEMASIKRVQDWYAQSFEVGVSFLLATKARS